MVLGNSSRGVARLGKCCRIEMQMVIVSKEGMEIQELTVVVDKFGDKIHVSENHASAAISLQAKRIESSPNVNTQKAHPPVSDMLAMHR